MWFRCSLPLISFLYKIFFKISESRWRKLGAKIHALPLLRWDGDGSKYKVDVYYKCNALPPVVLVPKGNISELVAYGRATKVHPKPLSFVA